MLNSVYGSHKQGATPLTTLPSYMLFRRKLTNREFFNLNICSSKSCRRAINILPIFLQFLLTKTLLFNSSFGRCAHSLYSCRSPERCTHSLFNSRSPGRLSSVVHSFVKPAACWCFWLSAQQNTKTPWCALEKTFLAQLLK